MEVHPIQSHILQTILRSADGIRYRDAQAEDVENDLYNYHLQYLVKQKLIVKRNNKYFLTDKGNLFIEELYPINPLGNVANKFKVAALICLIRKNEEGEKEVLYQTRKRQPMYGFKCIPGGPINKGEDIITAAKRKLKEETGLVADLVVIGMVRKMRKESDIFYFVTASENYDGTLVENSIFGKNYWINLDDAIKNELSSNQGSKQLAKFFETLKTINYKDIPFFTSEEKITE